MDATTLARVKDLLGSESSASIDGALQPFIPAVSRAIEHLLRRQLERKARVEEYRVHALRNKALTLRQAPVDIEAEFEVVEDDRADFAGAEPMEADAYHVEARPGVVRFFDAVLGPTYFQVTYTGGLATNTDGLIADYPDIAQAATLWVVEAWRRRTGLSKTAEAARGGASISYTEALQHPPRAVRGLLDPYRRLSFRG